MATLMERDVALVTKDSSGNNVIEYPVTRAAQVEDLATVITDAIKAQAPSPANMKGATASAAGTAGLVPAPAAGAQAKYLRGDGTWQTPPNTTYSNMKGATASAAGTAGLVPAPAAGENNMPLCGDATFKTLPIAGGGTGATTAAAALKALIGSTAIGSTTKPIYYDGAGALKACADSIGGGGIVAALLEQNGYVKFANGLIIQWGQYTGAINANPAIAYPLSFTDANKIVVIIGKNDGCGAAYSPNTVDITQTGFGLSMYDGRVGIISWISLGT